MPFIEQISDESIVSPIAPTKLSAELLERLLGAFVCAHPHNPRVLVTAGHDDASLSVDLEFPTSDMYRLGEAMFLCKLLLKFGLRGSGLIYNDQGGTDSVPLGMAFETDSSSRERLAARATLRTLIAELGANPSHLPFLVHDVPSVNTTGFASFSVKRLSPAWLFDVVGSLCVNHGQRAVNVTFDHEGVTLYRPTSNWNKEPLDLPSLRNEITEVFRWFGAQTKVVNNNISFRISDETEDRARLRLNECRKAAQTLAAA